MAITLDEFRKEIKPQVQQAARAKAVDIIAQMSLTEVRKARGENQLAVAKNLDIAQSNVSQLENREDALVSTLQQYINALGGELEIHAKFPDGQHVLISL